MQVQLFMTRPVVTLTAERSVADATECMRRHGFRHLPVVSTDGKLVGMVSDRDLRDISVRFDELPAPGEWQPSTAPITEVMAPEPARITPGEDVRTAIEIMDTGGFHCLPVVDRGELVGIVTGMDLLHGFMRVLDRLERGDPVVPVER